MSIRYEKPDLQVILIDTRSMLCGSKTPRWEEIPIEDAKEEEEFEWDEDKKDNINIFN